MDKKTATV